MFLILLFVSAKKLMEKTLSYSIGTAFALVSVGVFVALLPWLHKANINWGEYGSYLQGTTAAFWALAGVVLIFAAFVLQNEQLKAQRTQYEEEQKEQRAEQARQAEQFALQQQSIRLQNFDSAFFQLLGLHNNIVDAFMVRDVLRHKDGRECFYEYYQDFRLENASMGGKSFASGVAKYEDYYQDRQPNLGHYFRNLYHLIKFVAEHDALKHPNPDVEYRTRRRYTSLVRAQLSAYELAFLFYDGLSRHGRDKFKPLIEQFGLLEALDVRLLLNGIGMNASKEKGLYAKSAFE